MTKKQKKIASQQYSDIEELSEKIDLQGQNQLFTLEIGCLKCEGAKYHPKIQEWP